MTCQDGLQYHTDGHTLTMEYLRGQYTFKGMANRMTKIEEISQAPFSFVGRDDVGFCRGGFEYDLLEYSAYT